MSSAFQIIKRINSYTLETTLASFQKAVAKAGMYSFGFDMKYGEGTLSEMDQETLSRIDIFDSQKVKTFIFVINVPGKSDYDSFTWLINDPDYFVAIRINNPMRYDKGEFIFRLMVSYFEDNTDDYLWYDGADGYWYYTADDILKLSKMPYNPLWSVEKLV